MAPELGAGTFGVAVKAAIMRGTRLLVLYKSADEARTDPDPRVRVDLPGGRIGFGESPLDALRREVAEETGLDVEPIAAINTWHYVKDQFQLVGIDYLCECGPGEVTLSDEHHGFGWLTEEEVRSRHPEQRPQFAAAFRTDRRSSQIR